MPTYESTIDLDGHEVEVSVEYSTVAASGDGWNEPHEPAHIEIESVTTEDGREVVLTSKQEAWMEERIAKALKAFEDHGYDEGPPDSYDAEYDDHYGGD